ncbi:MAG: adenylate/guanylate cyclase domain-containing protein [Gemmatimonadota bacterium]|nr:adenylate/guanylate cyclase domain-containing protein [Gemmatimonadota bacterium]
MTRRLCAIFALDMVGYSRLVGEDEKGTLARQRAHMRELVEPAIADHHGRVVKGTGDGVLAEFASAVDAVECAARIQRAMPEREADVPDDRCIRYRIGINVGDIVAEDGDIYGDGVNVAARIESLADPGGVFISGSAFSQVKNKVEVGFEDLGPRSLKNIAEPVRVYRVLLDPAAAGRPPRRRRLHRRKLPPEMVAAAAIIVVLGGGLAIRDFLMRDRTAHNARQIRSSPLERLSETEDPRRIAVLYFEPRTPQEAVPFIAAGLSEALIDELSAVKALRVVSANGVAPFRGAAVAPDSIGRALSVGTLVNGSVSMADEAIRVAVSFVRASTGEQFGSTRIEGSHDRLFDLQDDLSQEVASFLLQMLGEEIQLLESRAGTDNVEAWELLQRAAPLEEQAGALMQMGDRPAAMASLDAADSILAAAEALAPEWVEPTVGRGWLDYRKSRFTGFHDRLAAGQWIDRGMEHAELALRLAPENPDALELRGTLRYWKYLLNLGGTPSEAEELVQAAESDLRNSVAASPRQASAWTSLSHLLMNQDRLAEGKLAALRSYEADPYLRNAHLTLWRLFGASFDLGDGVEARRWCEEGRRRFPERPRFRQCGLMVFALTDTEPDIPEAWRMLEEWVEVSPPAEQELNRHRGRMFVAWALARAGLADSARAVAVRARAGPDIDPTRNVAYWEAIVRGMLGDLDEAITQWSIHVAANPDVTVGDGRIWYMEPLHRDPRFATQ